MSWFTVGEIVLWLVLATGLGVALGWLLHEVWNRSRAPETPVAVPVTPPTTPTAIERHIKGNQKSMIYHAPGSPAYERTHADVWFASEDEAVAAGYRKPKNQ